MIMCFITNYNRSKGLRRTIWTIAFSTGCRIRSVYHSYS